jgi:hypothetical protein
MENGLEEEGLASKRLRGNISVAFQGERGVGQGIVREFYDSLARELFDPSRALFQYCQEKIILFQCIHYLKSKKSP